jgi:hypothetical protein
MHLTHNPLTSLQGSSELKEMGGWIYVEGCPIKSHILGVFFIKGCIGVMTYTFSDFDNAAGIVNKYISKGRAGLFECQKELIEAGLADFAQI